MPDAEKVIEDLGTAIMCVNNLLTYEQFIVRDKVVNAMIQAINLIEEQKQQQPEIVRCKDCENYEHWYGNKGRCFIWQENGIDVFDDGFCNYGNKSS